MVTKDDFVIIKDGEDDGNELFNGAELIMHINSIKFDGGNTIQKRERGFQSLEYVDPNTSSTETLDVHYNRRKPNVSFKGLQIPTITISGMMSNDSIGNDTITIGEDVVKVLTPTRFMKMAISGRMFYLKDRALIASLNTENEDGERVYGDDGIPVAIEAWSMEPIFDDENKGISFSITFAEDKE